MKGDVKPYRRVKANRIEKLKPAGKEILKTKKAAKT